MTKEIPNRLIGHGVVRALLVSAVLIVSPCVEAESPGDPNLNPMAVMDWELSAHSYATAATCAKKRFSFSSGDVEKLKAIAVEKAKDLDKSMIDEHWGQIVVGLEYAPPTAVQCFEAYEKETFTGNNFFGF